MAEYIPSPRDWVRDQVELYERTARFAAKEACLKLFPRERQRWG